MPFRVVCMEYELLDHYLFELLIMHEYNVIYIIMLVLTIVITFPLSPTPILYDKYTYGKGNIGSSHIVKNGSGHNYVSH